MSELQFFGASLGSPRWQKLAPAVSLALCGCLADPPERSSPDLLPPFIEDSQVIPSLTSVFEVQAGPGIEPEPIELKVPFRSEDRSTGLTAVLYLDFSPRDDAPTDVARQRLTPSDFDDLDRQVEMVWSVPDNMTGCHSLTLMITHDNNFSLMTLLPNDRSLAAFVTWWLNIRDGGTSASLESCPGGQGMADE